MVASLLKRNIDEHLSLIKAGSALMQGGNGKFTNGSPPPIKTETRAAGWCLLCHLLLHSHTFADTSHVWGLFHMPKQSQLENDAVKCLTMSKT